MTVTETPQTETQQQTTSIRLLFSALIIFSGFTVIPYITIYAVSNVGIAQTDIPIVYLVGGFATFISARLIGRWATYPTLANASYVN